MIILYSCLEPNYFLLQEVNGSDLLLAQAEAIPSAELHRREGQKRRSCIQRVLSIGTISETSVCDNKW